jgi:YidC/Oxa1 family membrane protein insertase
MPQPKNYLARRLFLLLTFVVLVGVPIAVWRNSVKPPAPPAPLPPPPSAPGPQPVPPSTAEAPKPEPTPEAPSETRPETAAASAPEQPATAQSTAQTAAPAPVSLSYRVQPVDVADQIAPLGSLDKASPYKLQIEFSPYGAGIRRVLLTEHFETIRRQEHVTLLEEKPLPPAPGFPPVKSPFNVRMIEITPVGGAPSYVSLDAADVWMPVPGKPGAFQATILDSNNQPALKLERVFILPENATRFTIRQHVINLSPIPLTVRLFETGPVDLPADTSGYGGDKRRVRFGYLLDKGRDPSQSNVLSSRFLIEHKDAAGERTQAEATLWPNETSRENEYTLSWVGATNRYFGAAAFPVYEPSRQTSPAFTWVGSVERVLLDDTGHNLALELRSNPFTLAPAGVRGDWADLSHSVYAGPLNRKELRQDPVTSGMGLTGLVVYNFGGMCASCTFEWMSNLLLWILHTLHDRVLHDWAMAIIFLVLIVRTVLHPVTKWSQIRMARFGKQMSAVAPKQKQLQEKYKNDPKKLQEETAKLWREEGISPTGMLGCLPMLLQMPVWIALYAVLFFSVELRHSRAFYGVFQSLQPDGWPTWQFLGDLSKPDTLIAFSDTLNIPLIGSLIGPVHGFNILPVLLATVFFIQQKYLTPPTTATLTPEQEMQQKMMKWMMVFLFPIAMYNAPSGLAIYFICNSTFAILESRYIRAHMDKYDLLNVEKMKAERAARAARRPGAAPREEGFLARLQRLAEEKQKEAMRLQQQRRKKP